MKYRILLIVLPFYVIISFIVSHYFLFVLGTLEGLVYGLVYIGIAIWITVELFIFGIHKTESHFKDISHQYIDVENIEIVFNDGIKSRGVYYRLSSETIETSDGKRYPEPRPTIIFFHGLMGRKESSDKWLIPLTHMGYLTFSFDQIVRKGQKGLFQTLNDTSKVLDIVCNTSDVKIGSICCIGISLGGIMVLTKCYVDNRVAMVIGMSTIHDFAVFCDVKNQFLSLGWYVKRQMSKNAIQENTLKTTPHYYLKNDPEFNKNRVFLIHGKKDSFFPPSISFYLNKKQANIPDKNTLLLDCGHGLDGQETLILGTIIKWLNENDAMRIITK
ncbi:MAG: alpha/beta hydrolase family protein [Candidatus Helarchaeota archaeon]